MFNESNFIIRASGKREGNFYIDYAGEYKVSGIAKAANLDISEVKEIYTTYKASYDDTQDVYYFGNFDIAKKALNDVLNKVGVETRGKLLFLTEPEMEYIRMALIKEGSTSLIIKNKIKENIFNKLNN